jgi:hypothetical protein
VCFKTTLKDLSQFLFDSWRNNHWLKKLRLFVYVLNLKIDRVVKVSPVVVIRWFSLNEAPLGLFKFISIKWHVTLKLIYLHVFKAEKLFLPHALHPSQASFPKPEISFVLNSIDRVVKVSPVVVIRWFSLNEAPLGLFKFISDYLPYFEKINIFFNIITNTAILDEMLDWFCA